MIFEQKMDPSYIYFKEIDIHQDNSFTADFSKENEIEEVSFNKENEYRVTGLTINSILPDEKIIKIENVKEQKRISNEIQELIKNFKEPDLTFFYFAPRNKYYYNSFCKKERIRFTKIKIVVF